MKMSVAKYQAYLKENEPVAREATVVLADLATANFGEIATALLKTVQELLAEGRLGYATFEQVSEPAVTFNVEMSPINLPMTDARKANQFFKDENEMIDLNLYLVTKSEYLNVSHFHIDLLGSSELDPLTFVSTTAELISTNWQTIRDRFQNPPAPKPVVEPAKKTVAKKSTGRKSTTKKATTKKTTTKKSGAKKAMAKKVATKKSAAKKTTTKKVATKKATTKK